jgi:hypothetical protein
MKVIIEDNGTIRYECPGCGHQHNIPLNHGWSFNGDENNPSVQPSIKHYHPEEFYQNHPDSPRYICHYFITNGRIEYCGDCTHALSGKTIELPDINP